MKTNKVHRAVTFSPWEKDGMRGCTEKERDTETSFDYFGARYYDSELGRWLSVDPMADKYPGWSPYAYCLNLPNRVVDPQGTDVIVLASPKGASGLWHGAVLIGNDKGGWNYYSKDGTKAPNRFVGEPKVGEAFFHTFDEFLRKINTDTRKGKTPYSFGHWIETSSSADDAMNATAAKVVRENYNLFTGEHCWELVEEVLRAGGLKAEEETSFVGKNKEGDTWSGTERNRPIFPKQFFKIIQKQNKGRSIYIPGCTTKCTKPLVSSGSRLYSIGHSFLQCVS